MKNHHLRSEDGAIAATVTVMMVALLGIAMLAMDGGQMLTSRRNLLTDTDAAALAAAREMVGRDCATATDDAEDLAREVLALNDATTTRPVEPAVSCVGPAGRATVTAVRNTDLAFGGLAGIPDVDVQATSVAQYGPLQSGTGLRPLAICNRDFHFLGFAFEAGLITESEIKAMVAGDESDDFFNLVEDMIDDANAVVPVHHLKSYPALDGQNKKKLGGTYATAADVHRVDFALDDSAFGCGGSSGNWGWINFDGTGGGPGGPGGAKAIKEWLEFGYDHPITVGDAATEDCAPEKPAEKDCIAETGALGGSPDDELAAIQCPYDMDQVQCMAAGKAFPVIIFDSVVGPGATARYDHVAFLGLILRDWGKITGSSGWFGFEFVEEFITSGTISGTPSAIGPGLIGVQLCGGGYAGTVDDYCVVP